MASKNSHQPRTDQMPAVVDSGLERPVAWANRRSQRQHVWLLVISTLVAVAAIAAAGIMVDASFIPLMLCIVAVFVIAIVVALALAARDRNRARREDALADRQQAAREDAVGSEGVQR